jgi:hypothetical protein
MLKNVSHRLNHYIIVECNGSTLSWVKHSPLGFQRSGRCKILGNILVLLPCDHEEPGYLKLEFHEHLRKLPPWTKTIYYCYSASLMRVGISQSITCDAINSISENKISCGSVSQTEIGSYRLNRCKITIDKNLVVSWKTISGLEKNLGGSCYIESNIILLGPQVNESNDSQRRLFFTELKSLPLWNKTAAWSYAKSLKIVDS